MTAPNRIPGKGRLSASAKAGSKTAGKAAKTVRKAGTTSLKLRVKRKGKLAVTVTFTPKSGPKLTAKTTAHVK